MNTASAPKATANRSEAAERSWRWAIPVWAAITGAFGALLFLSAGRMDWVAGWLYLAMISADTAVSYGFIRCKNPELLDHRRHFGKDISCDRSFETSSRSP